ncbi:MAG: NAD-dependent epimerase/dehydratase family protein [Patescibacteria group bacterium]
MPQKIIFDKKNVLVAGGAGFIGSHLCDELIKTCKVICIDNFSSSSEKNIDHLLANPDFVFINHDLSEPLDLEALPELKKFKIEFQGLQEVYNLACPISPRRFLENRLNILLANSFVVKHLLDYTVKYEAKFLQFSSSVVYGNRQTSQNLQVKEEDLGLVDNLSERSAYDEGERFAETMVFNYRQIYGIDAKIVRVFRTYGPRMELNDDQMIPDMVLNALNNQDLVIFGGPEFSSSFCYIDDIIDGALKVMNSALNGPINLGSDVDIKLADLAAMIIAAAGSQSKIVHAETKLFMSELLLPDIHKARNELNWMPVVTLENGIKKTVFALRANTQLRGLDG